MEEKLSNAFQMEDSSCFTSQMTANPECHMAGFAVTTSSLGKVLLILVVESYFEVHSSRYQFVSIGMGHKDCN